MALLPGDSLDGRASSFKEKLSFSTVPEANLSEASHSPRQFYVTIACTYYWKTMLQRPGGATEADIS